MIVYLENPNESTEKQLKSLNEFNKVTEFQLKTQKSFYFYTLAMKSRKEI